MNHGDPVGQLEYPRWRKIEIPCDYGRDLHPCVIYKDFLIIHGGFTRIALNDVLICNLNPLSAGHIDITTSINLSFPLNEYQY